MAIAHQSINGGGVKATGASAPQAARPSTSLSVDELARFVEGMSDKMGVYPSIPKDWSSSKTRSTHAGSSVDYNYYQRFPEYKNSWIATEPMYVDERATFMKISPNAVSQHLVLFRKAEEGKDLPGGMKKFIARLTYMASLRDTLLTRLNDGWDYINDHPDDIAASNLWFELLSVYEEVSDAVDAYDYAGRPVGDDAKALILGAKNE